MKKVITAFFSLALVTCLIIYSCQKDKQQHEAESTEMFKKSSLSPEESKASKLGWLPLKSKVTETGGVVSVIAPGDWSYIGFDKDNNLVKVEPLTKKNDHLYL